MVDNDILDGDQNQEDHNADDVVAADHKGAKSLDHFAGGTRSGIAIQQNQARRRDVERQPEQGHQQQSRWKHAEVHRLGDVQRNQQHDDGKSDIAADQNIEQERRQWHDHRQNDAQHRDGHRHLGQIAASGKILAPPVETVRG